ncbi:MAG: kynureninase [Gemmataceae bacterium]|nr:kynureninase [Gemmataceae bacterium]
MSGSFQPDEGFALALDARDPLRPYREQFLIPPRPDGLPAIYFCGHSLGLQPRGVRALIEQELDDWARLGVEAHFQGRTPWYDYHEQFRDSGARLVGARPGEVVMMNSLTINLHLMLATFYRPDGRRYKLLIDEPAFPSDLYAVQTHLRQRGLDHADALLAVGPPLTPAPLPPGGERGERGPPLPLQGERGRGEGGPGEHLLREEDVEAVLTREGEEIAVVLLNAVNFLTGQWLDVARLTRAAHERGCVVGCDLAHAAGNVPLALHDWNVDFAVWCSYKYLNSGPGAVAGCFVHERHGRSLELPRLAGWWGNDPATRFRMHEQRTFIPREGADGWQVSNPPILAMAPLRASLALFDEAGMPALRAKSELLTGYLEYLLGRLQPGAVEVLTPREPGRRGCALSLRVRQGPREVLAALQQEGVVCDFREPDVIRVAPVPLYNTFHEVWRFARVLAACGFASSPQR